MAEARKNPWPRRIGIGLLAVLGLALLIVLGAWLWINSSGGRSFVEDTVEDLEIAGQRIQLDGLDGSVLGRFQVDRIELRDRDGVWLVAQGIDVNWNPRAILSKTAEVDALRVADLDVLRRPILVPSGDPNAEPRVTTFDIDGIALPDVFLAEAVATRDVQLRATASVYHAPGGGNAVVDATTEQGDAVTADLAWSPELVLSGEADIDGAPGGLLAGLLRLGPGQGVTADVTTADDTTTVSAEIDGQPFVQADILRRQASVSVTGTLQPQRLPVLERVAPLLGGETRVEATVPLDEGEALTLVLQSPLSTLRATGVREGNVLVMTDIAVEATDPLAPFMQTDQFSLGRIIANGRGRYDLDTGGGSFEGTVDGRNIRYQTYRVERLDGPASFTLLDNVLSFDTRLTGRATGRAALANGARLDTAGRLDLGAQSIALRRANIDLPGLRVQGAGRIGYGNGLDAAFDGTYRIDTSVFRDGPAAILAGRTDVAMTPNGPVARVEGRAEDITGLADAIVPLVDGGLAYTADLAFEEGEVLIPSFTASNERLRATGEARWAAGEIRADVTYTVDRYTFAALDAQGISGEAIITGPPSRIEYATRTRFGAAVAGGLAVTDGVAVADGTFIDGVTNADVRVTGTSDQGAVDTTFNVNLDETGWQLDGFEGTLGELRVSGPVSGFGGDIAALRADLEVDGRTPLIPAQRVSGRVRLSDARADVDLDIESLQAGPLQDTDVGIVAQGPRDAVAFTVTAEGRYAMRDFTRDVVLRAQGTADLEEPGLSVAAPFTGSIGRQEFAGRVDAARNADGWGGELAFDGLGGAAALALEPGADGRITFDLDALDVSEIMILLGRPVAGGTLSGEGAFRMLSDRIEGQGVITLDDLANPGSDTEPVTVRTTIALANERLDVRADVVDGSLSGNITLGGSVDTFPRAPFMQWPPVQPLDGRVDVNGDIGPLVELFLPPQTDVSGQLDADFTFVQPTDLSRVSGVITLRNGVFEQGAFGLRLRDITTDIRMAGLTVDVTTFSANGRDGGTLRGSGQMGLGEGTGTVDIRAEKLRVVDRREGYAELSGTISVSRTTELFKLGGDLLVTDAEFNIARLPKPGLPTLEVDFGEGDDAEEEEPRFASTATELDLRVRSNGRIELTGRGLDARANLDARITGPFDAPVISGTGGLDRGRFDFLGKRFTFRESELILETDVLQSRLNVEAVRETADLTAVVRITGTAERPEIELSSEPELPEDEVLSRILFGRSPTQLSAIEAARFAAALAQLSGGGGFDLLGSVENAIGLDTLDITQNETGQAQLTTGKYLSDDVYVEVRTAAEGSPGIAVEWEARRNISVEAETIPGESESISVQWRKDFD